MRLKFNAISIAIYILKMETDHKEEEKEKQRPPAHRLPAPGLDPWLVCTHGRRVQDQTLFCISEGRYHVRSIPEMAKNGYMHLFIWLGTSI